MSMINAFFHMNWLDASATLVLFLGLCAAGMSLWTWVTGKPFPGLKPTSRMHPRPNGRRRVKRAGNGHARARTMPLTRLVQRVLRTLNPAMP
jgi:hypothetical protein